LVSLIIFGFWILSAGLVYLVLRLTKGLRITSARIAVRVALIAFLVTPSPLIKIYPLPPPLYVQLFDQFKTARLVNLDDYTVNGRLVDKNSNKGIDSATVIVLWGRWNVHSDNCLASSTTVTGSEGEFRAELPGDSKYKMRKRIKGAKPRIIIYLPKGRTEFLLYEPKVDSNQIQLATISARTSRKARLAYLDSLTNKITCTGMRVLDSNLFPVKFKIYEEARNIAKSPDDLKASKSLCIAAIEEKVRTQDLGLPPIEVDRRVQQYVDRGACKQTI